MDWRNTRDIHWLVTFCQFGHLYLFSLPSVWLCTTQTIFPKIIDEEKETKEDKWYCSQPTSWTGREKVKAMISILPNLVVFMSDSCLSLILVLLCRGSFYLFDLASPVALTGVQNRLAWKIKAINCLDSFASRAVFYFVFTLSF